MTIINLTEPLIPSPVEIIPLSLAQLCMDCNCITRSPNNHCLACGSHSVIKIVNVLGRV